MDQHKFVQIGNTNVCGAVVRYGNGEVGACGLNILSAPHLSPPPVPPAPKKRRKSGKVGTVFAGIFASIVAVAIAAIVVGGLVWLVQVIWAAVLS